MKLSIITINYNNAAGLKKTLDSVAAQTYTDFEHIIVDGASSDGSVDEIIAYSQSPIANRHKITWLSEPDTGIYNAMNKGIKKASGDYLLFLNSGDFLVENNVLECVLIHNCYADILCARCNVSDNGIVTWTSNPPDQVTFGTLYCVGLAHQSTFIRKSLFEQYGYYNESYRYNADIEFWYRTIIDNHVTTQRIDVITTDYNLDGISSKEHQTDLYVKEVQQILAPYKAFIADYDMHAKKEKDIHVFDWLKNHKLLYAIVLLIYKIERKLKKLL